MKYLSALIVLFTLTISTVKAQIKVSNLFLGPQYGLSFYEKDKCKSELGASVGIEFYERMSSDMNTTTEIFKSMSLRMPTTSGCPIMAHLCGTIL